jgi:hypothetical protein
LNPPGNAAAALLVAILGEQADYRLEKRELQERLGVSSWLFGRALARARYSDLITIPDGVVTLTPAGVKTVEEGKAGLNREERRRLERAAR